MATSLSEDRLAGLGEQGTIELVLPAGRSVRRRRVPATLLPIATALPLLLDLEDSPATTATARIWASVMTAGLGLIARGRLHPAVSPSGMDAWRAGPLDPGDHACWKQLANAMPPLAHAVPLAETRAAAASALASLSCRRCVGRARRHAPADGGGRNGKRIPICSQRSEPTPATELRPWLAEASAGLDGGASFALRVQLGGRGRAGAERRASDLQHRRPESRGGRGRTCSRCRRRCSPASGRRPSAICSWRCGVAPGHGSRSAALLGQRIPDSLPLDDDLLADLIARRSQQPGERRHRRLVAE